MAKDVATPNGNGDVTRATETFIEYLSRRAREDSEGKNYEIAASQLDRILTADDVQAMWDADEFESLGGRDIVDVEMRINSFTVHETSDQYNAILGHYVMVQAQRLADGREFTWNTGAPLVIGKLRWLESAELLGTASAECVIRGTETANGTVLKLKPVPSRALVP